MDRRWAFAALALSTASAAAAPVAAPLLREIRWIAADTPRAELVRVLTAQPAECLAPPADAASADQVAVGRAMFAAPLLLGGQAARAGLSCAACHVSGRGNPHFVFPGVSGAPGTADVTSSLFSTRRGDGIANPRPIPDLAADPPKISRDPASPALRTFIRGLIVEEFDGLEPPPRILDGLAAYVRALRSDCSALAQRTSEGELGDAAAAVLAARTALGEGDAAAARLLLSAARSALGRIDERFAGRPAIARLLARRDGELRRLQADLAGGKSASAALTRWTKDTTRDAAALRAAEPGSLYAPASLERALVAAGGEAAANEPSTG
ncbi:hypothetical protein [Novosphingobium sp. Chol11]|uniref:hypothetical protein n=1 Tax=Novosphingobium sp. Chol11 TaxID=1385763 RepID=UPI0025E91E78|nr:hypothetical protein [Novosphingobium sp. Chol11]